MATRFRYPPCLPGPLSEKPRRHEFEIKLARDGEAITRVGRNGLKVYHVICKRCGYIDPKPVYF